MLTAEKLAAVLEVAATLLQTSGYPAVGPWPRWTLGPLSFDGATFRLTVIAHPDFIRARAARLLRTANGSVFTEAYDELSAARKPYSLRRSRYNKAVEAAFALDGETDNVNAYRALYNV